LANVSSLFQQQSMCVKQSEFSQATLVTKISQEPLTDQQMAAGFIMILPVRAERLILTAKVDIEI
jgi:hypothetical protein